MTAISVVPSSSLRSFQIRQAAEYESGPCPLFLYGRPNASHESIKRFLSLHFVADLNRIFAKLNELLGAYNRFGVISDAEKLHYERTNQDDFLLAIDNIKHALNCTTPSPSKSASQECKAMYHGVRGEAVKAQKAMIDTFAAKALYVPLNISELGNFVPDQEYMPDQIAEWFRRRITELVNHVQDKSPGTPSVEERLDRIRLAMIKKSARAEMVHGVTDPDNSALLEELRNVRQVRVCILDI